MSKMPELVPSLILFSGNCQNFPPNDARHAISLKIPAIRNNISITWNRAEMLACNGKQRV